MDTIHDIERKKRAIKRKEEERERILKNKLRIKTKNKYGKLCVKKSIKKNPIKTPIERLYWNWYSMKDRCLNKKNSSFHRYGARGITVCERWLQSFQNFYNDMGLKPTGKSLGRIDNDKGYFYENCRWETPKQQCANLSTNKHLIYQGSKFHYAALERKLGLSKTIISRILNSTKAKQSGLSKQELFNKYFINKENF